MSIKPFSYLFSIVLLCIFFIVSCKNSQQPPVSDIAETPEQLDEKVAKNIRQSIEYAGSDHGDIGDSVFLFSTRLAQQLYEQQQYQAVWSGQEKWKLAADSLLSFISESKLYGLFPGDYHYPVLNTIVQKINADTLAKSDRRDAALWAKADLLLSDALIHLIKDVKLGRLPKDSVTLRKDSVISDAFYLKQLTAIAEGGSLVQLLSSLEPKHEGYQQLKTGIPEFLENADNKVYTKVPSPKEGEIFRTALQKRLYEGGYIAFDSTRADSVQLAEAVKEYQREKNITVDGKAGEGTVRMLNTTDAEKFLRIAITMDRYKLLPEKMPEKYIWVNLPSFYMRLQDKDSVKLVSKIVCGKPHTRTPLLTSAISEIITYPQWTVPNSIIVKEILPAVKRNPGYLAKKGFSLVDKNGDEVDPFTVDWSKYSKGIPYKVVQGSGDANALGVLKFNFPNKYAVYLHDTNQRYLFGQPVRTLSHGCVRVQEWEKLATYIIRNDRKEIDGEIAMLDSMDAWLERKEKHSIPLRNRLPVYIRYFTCEGKPGGIAFFDDIYGEDKMLGQKYFKAADKGL
jgi:murein L,D-transpeptidase YcbB/YkuD